MDTKQTAKEKILTLSKLHSNIPNFHQFLIQMLMKIFPVSGSLHEKIYSLNIFGQEFTDKVKLVVGNRALICHSGLLCM